MNLIVTWLERLTLIRPDERLPVLRREVVDSVARSRVLLVEGYLLECGAEVGEALVAAAATAAAEPPEEPPGTRSPSQGLRQGP